jgi:hypothetical protein
VNCPYFSVIPAVAEIQAAQPSMDLPFRGDDVAFAGRASPYEPFTAFCCLLSAVPLSPQSLYG